MVMKYGRLSKTDRWVDLRRKYNLNDVSISVHYTVSGILGINFLSNVLIINRGDGPRWPPESNTEPFCQIQAQIPQLLEFLPSCPIIQHALHVMTKLVLTVDPNQCAYNSRSSLQVVQDSIE